MSDSLLGPLDPARGAGWEDPPARKGFLTDTSICIGCKACEVACKEWNAIPEDGLSLLGSSYDNTGSLGASTWRHVAFIEQPSGSTRATSPIIPVDLGMPSLRQPAPDSPPEGPSETTDAGSDSASELSPEKADFRWLMSSDVCKHCTHAACLDVCPTGSLFRTEFGTVVVQDDICNGCGYCVPACPFGVIERRTDHAEHIGGTAGPGTAAKVTKVERVPEKRVRDKNVGIAQKCTLCYDRLSAGNTPACAQACPTQSIQFGDVDELRERAQVRMEQLHAQGVPEARLYGADPNDGIGGAGAMFLLLDEPEVYGLPPDPVVTTKDLAAMWKKAGLAGLAMLGGAAVSFVGGRR
ncbi:MAG: 4Fe-4S dicluster domain-containing protein [Cryobacterium sp.]|nr:4Fe-4S dicluster domain-containing protein [Cryobacterium sp.]